MPFNSSKKLKLTVLREVIFGPTLKHYFLSLLRSDFNLQKKKNRQKEMDVVNTLKAHLKK